MFAKKSNGAIIASLILTVIMWGGSNVGTKYLVSYWPPALVGSARLLCAGLILLGLLRWTPWLGTPTPLSPKIRRELWWRGTLSLAIYIAVFNWALHFTTAAHVAVYLGASPVWALLWEERPSLNLRSLQRYGAAGLALAGVVVLFWHALRSGTTGWVGELLGMTASVTWALYGRQSRKLGEQLSGAEVSAHTIFRAGLWLLPLALVEVARRGVVLRMDLFLVHGYCVLAGGVLAYIFWNNALRHWETSKVFLFNNLIPVSTMIWSHFCLGEPVTRTFGLAMILVVLGVVLGQTQWQKILGPRWVPVE